MTVAELIEQLKALPQDAVVVRWDRGQDCYTELQFVEPLKGRHMVCFARGGYSVSGLLVEMTA